VRDLAARYRTVGQDGFENFLRDEVGVRAVHASRILAWLESNHGAVLQAMRVTLSLEGNIGAGKTTFLRMLEGSGAQGSLLRGGAPPSHAKHLVLEPVEEWQKVPFHSGEINALEYFYNNSPRYAYLFQNHVFMTRWDKVQRTAGFHEPVRMTERSVWSDRMVFVRQLVQDRLMEDVELAVYDDMFNRVLQQHSQVLVPDGFVYLRVSPDVALSRINRRGRSEESKIPPSYLEGLHQKHEEWFIREHPIASLRPRGGGRGDPGLEAVLGGYAWDSDAQTRLVLPRKKGLGDVAGEGEATVQGLQWGDVMQLMQDIPEPPAAIASDIFLLNPDKMAIEEEGVLGSWPGQCRLLLQGIPYLNVEYSEHIDVQDPAARAELTRKVDLFSEWVDKVRTARSRMASSAVLSMAGSGLLPAAAVLPKMGPFRPVGEVRL